MLRGIYTSGMGMTMQNKKMEVVANNLANINTNGYKRDSAVFQAFNDILIKRINDSYTPSNPSGEVGSMRFSADIGQIFTDYSQGKLIETGNKTDLAISNSNTSFFTVQVQNDSGDTERYTRDGAFTLDAKGKLVTKEGYAVKGEKGDIILSNQEFEINSKGEVIQDGNVVGKLLIKTFKDTSSLRKVGENLVEVEGDAEEKPFEGAIVQGFTEGSNINPVKEMIDMIMVVKAYEASQKAIKAHDETLGRAVNDIPGLR